MAAAIGVAFLLIQRRQAALISGINQELSAANSFLTAVSGKIARYLSPQIYRSIFSGELDAAITTERKKLTTSSPISRISPRSPSACSRRI